MAPQAPQVLSLDSGQVRMVVEWLVTTLYGDLLVWLDLTMVHP
jgi:hypothetical protein